MGGSVRRSLAVVQLFARWGFAWCRHLGTPPDEYDSCVITRSRAFSTLSKEGQKRTYTPFLTVYLVISLPKLPFIHRIYMVLANPNSIW